MNENDLNAENKSKTGVTENVDLDTALEIIGYGKFHYKIMTSCAFCFISSGLQYGLSAYAMPAAHCELQLTSTEIGFINTSFLVGAICSSFLWGVVADLTGRRKVLIVTLLLDIMVTISCALVQNFAGMITCRFFNGFLIGAPSSVTFTYLAEFHAPKHRTKTIYYSGVFFTLPWLILPGLAWSMLPLKIDVKFDGFILYSPWRIFLIILTIPEIIAGIWIFYLPETPKFLAVVEPKKALAVLRHMYTINTGKNKTDFPIKSLLKDAIVRKTTTSARYQQKTKRLVYQIYSQIYSLFKPPLLPLTLLVIVVMFSNMFGYYGLGLWLPVLINRKQDFNDEAAVSTLRNSTSADNNKICLSNFDTNLYESTVAMGVSAILGNLIAGWLSGKFQKRIIPMVTLLLGGISAGWIYWINSSLQYLIASCIFQSTMSIANIAIGSVVVESFPTDVNAIAICTTMMAGRLGAIISNVVFGFLVDIHPAVAIFLVSGILILGAFLCLFLPNSTITPTKNAAIENKNEADVSVFSIT